MIRRLGIIQMGKIGDILILLPIAEHYNKIGYEIIWPIDKNIIKNFLEYIDYVKFIPCEYDCNDARKICNDYCCNTIIDFSFGLPNENSLNKKDYYEQDIYSFDEYKYQIANINFENKWNLKINRDLEKEKELYNKLVKNENYIVTQENSSDFKVTLKIPENTNEQRIEISKQTESIFDWLTILENAKKHILIESCFTNLIDQLNIKTESQICILKPLSYYGGKIKNSRIRGLPVLKLNWKYHE